MSKGNKDFEKDGDTLKNALEYKNNMFNTGQYVGTGKVPPTVSAPGNALPPAVVCFAAAALFVVLGVRGGFGYILF